MKKIFIVTAIAAAAFLTGCSTLKTEKTMFNEPWKNSRHFKKITHKTGFVSYLLMTDVSHNQQCLYFTTRELTNDGRFLVFQTVGKEDPTRDNTKIQRTIAVLDFAADEIFMTDFKTVRGGHGVYVDPDRAKIFCINHDGLRVIDLAKGERKSRFVCPIPQEIKKMGKDFRFYCTHLTMSKDNKKAFLDMQFDDRFVQGVLNVDEATFTKWGETDFYANHGQFNPVDPDMAMCAWEVDWIDSKGKLHHIRDHKELYYPRLWILESSGRKRMIPSVTDYATHEAWCRDGKGFFFCSTKNNQGMILHDLETGLQRQIMTPVWLEKENRAASASHGDVTADNRYAVCDIGAGVSVGYPWRMAFGNTVTGKNILIYDDGLVFNPNGNPPTVLHPHPHPHFVFNDKVVISTYVDVIGKMQILLTPVDQLVEKVDK